MGAVTQLSFTAPRSHRFWVVTFEVRDDGQQHVTHVLASSDRVGGLALYTELCGLRSPAFRGLGFYWGIVDREETTA